MLWLKPEQARTIVDHARSDAPNEACGLLLGTRGEVVEIVSARNVDPQPRTGFIVAPEDLYAILTRASSSGLEMVGAYHSHPAGNPIPSDRDVRESYYPHAIQLIVGLGKGVPELSAWQIVEGRVMNVELRIDSIRPAKSNFEARTFTSFQRLAVIAVGLIAVMFVIVVALALLPPPQIPN